MRVRAGTLRKPPRVGGISSGFKGGGEVGPLRSSLLTDFLLFSFAPLWSTFCKTARNLLKENHSTSCFYLKPSVISHCSQEKPSSSPCHKARLFWTLRPVSRHLLSPSLTMHSGLLSAPGPGQPLSLLWAFASAVPSARNALLHTPCLVGLFSSFRSSVDIPSAHWLSRSVSQSSQSRVHVKTTWWMKCVEKASLGKTDQCLPGAEEGDGQIFHMDRRDVF